MSKLPPKPTYQGHIRYEVGRIGAAWFGVAIVVAPNGDRGTPLMSTPLADKAAAHAWCEARRKGVMAALAKQPNTSSVFVDARPAADKGAPQ
jgi:hypothetical protein